MYIYHPVNDNLVIVGERVMVLMLAPDNYKVEVGVVGVWGMWLVVNSDASFGACAPALPHTILSINHLCTGTMQLASIT